MSSSPVAVVGETRAFETRLIRRRGGNDGESSKVLVIYTGYTDRVSLLPLCASRKRNFLLGSSLAKLGVALLASFFFGNSHTAALKCLTSRDLRVDVFAADLNFPPDGIESALEKKKIIKESRTNYVYVIYAPSVKNSNFKAFADRSRRKATYEFRSERLSIASSGAPIDFSSLE